MRINKLYLILFISLKLYSSIPVGDIIDGQATLRTAISQLQNNLTKKPDGFIAKSNEFLDAINKMKDYITKIPDSVTTQMHSSTDQLKKIINGIETKFNVLINDITNMGKKEKLKIDKKISKLKNILLNQQLPALYKQLENRRNLFINSVVNNLESYLTGQKSIQHDFLTEIQAEINIAKNYILNFETIVINTIKKQIPELKRDFQTIKKLIEKDINDTIQEITNFYNNLKDFVTAKINTFISYANNLNDSFNALGKNLIVIIDNLIVICSGGSQLLGGVKDFPLIPGLPATIIPTPLYTALSNSQSNMNDVKNILQSIKNAGIPTTADLAKYVSNLVQSIVKGIYNNPIGIPYAAASVLTAVDTIQNRINAMQDSIKQLENEANSLSSDASSVNISGIISDLKDILHNLADILQNDVKESLIFSIAVIESFKKHLSVDLLPPAMQDILQQIKNLLTNLAANLENVRDNIDLIGVSIGVEIAVIIAILTGSLIGITKAVTGIKKAYDYSKYKEKLKEELKELGFTDEEIKAANIPDEKSYKEIISKYEVALKTGSSADMTAVVNKMAEALKMEPKDVFAALKENLPITVSEKLSPIYEEINISIPESGINLDFPKQIDIPTSGLPGQEPTTSGLPGQESTGGGDFGTVIEPGTGSGPIELKPIEAQPIEVFEPVGAAV